jgi:lactoylglutathione lyase
MTNANLKQAVPFFMVKSMDRSLKFYVEGLRFAMKMDWRPEGNIEWCYLERDGVGLMLQEYKNEFLPNVQVGTGVSICFICEDALKLYQEFRDAGLPADEPFVGNSMWVTALKDPDGYVLNFESATDEKEETTFTQWRGK